MKFKFNKVTLFLIIIGALLLTHALCKTREYFTDSGSDSKNKTSGGSLISLNPKDYIIYGKGIHANKGNIPVTKILDEGNKFVFLAQDGDNTLVVKSTDLKGDSSSYYYKGTIDQMYSIPLIPNNKDFQVRYLKVGEPTKKNNLSGETQGLNKANTSTSADLSNDVNAYNPLDQTASQKSQQTNLDMTQQHNSNTNSTSNSFANMLLNQTQDMYTNHKQSGRGIPRSMILPGDEDLYILKSEIVPPVCPKCPDVSVCDKNEKCPPCPACARCPEPSFECKKVPNYNRRDDTYLPKPILSDFSQFGM